MTTQLANLTNPKTKTKSRKRADHEGSIFYSAGQKKWVAQVRTGFNPKTGHSIMKRQYATTQQEALQKLQAMREKYAKVTHVDADVITVCEWLSKWFTVYKLPKIKGNTAQSYKHVLEIAVEEIGMIKLTKLTEIDLQSVIFGRLKDHYRTAQNFRMLMKSALRRAVKSHLLQESPAEDLEMPKKPPKKTFIKPSSDDWQKLLEFPTSCYYCWKWIILTEFVTGARMSEVLALRWQDFSITTDEQGRVQSGTLHIRHALYLDANENKGGHRQVLMGDTKTAQGNRILPLPVDFCYELLHYRKLQLERKLMTPGFVNQDFIFTKADGHFINPSSFSSHYSFVRKKLGIQTTFHMLRHDMASRMKSTHIFDLKDIQAQLGHSSIQITMDIYTHIDEEQNAKVSCWLESGVTEILKRGKNTSQQISS